MPDASEFEAVMRYHERTKHHLYRYAPGPGELDWANQPDSFRRYAGAVLIGGIAELGGARRAFRRHPNCSSGVGS